MCAHFLVVVDRRNNRNADTGNFEMIYRQNAGSFTVQQFSGHDLTIVGKKLTRDIDWPMVMSTSKNFNNNNSIHPKRGSQSAITTQSQHTSNSNKQTLSDLLQKLRVRNQEMFQGALAMQKVNTNSIFEEVASLPSGNAEVAGVLLNKMRTLKPSPPMDQPRVKKFPPAPEPLEKEKDNGNQKQSPQDSKPSVPSPGIDSPVEKEIKPGDMLLDNMTVLTVVRKKLCTR